MVNLRAAHILQVAALLIVCCRVESAAQVATDSLPRLRLPSDFALTYKVVERRINTPGTIQRNIDANIGGLESAVRSGAISRDEANSRAKQVREEFTKHHEPETYELKVSHRANVLRVEWIGGSNPRIVLYNGEQTFLYSPTERLLTIIPGLKFRYLHGLPIPGAALPEFALARNVHTDPGSTVLRGNIYGAISGPEGPAYIPGTITVLPDDRDRVVTAEAKNKAGRPAVRWEFAGYKQMGTISIASQLAETFYDLTVKNGPPQPTVIAEYWLEAAQMSAPPAEQFDPRHLVSTSDPNDPKRHQFVQFGDTADAVSFVNDPSKTLEDQRREAAGNRTQMEQVAKQGQVMPRNLAGGVLVATFALLLGGWVVRGRFARPDIGNA
jgi:hypothetical protein